MSTMQRMWLGVALLPLMNFLGLNMCIWSTPQLLGVVSLFLLSASTATVYLFMVAVPATLWFAVSGLKCWNMKKERNQRFTKSIACLCFIGLWLLSLWSALEERHRAFVQASQIGDRIVQAIASFRLDRGEYPENLEQLVPEYLDSLPHTGMIGYPEFAYNKDRHDFESSPGEYELRIDCTSGGINFDRFIYWPSEDYPDQIQDNRVERIRTWAYVHE